MAARSKALHWYLATRAFTSPWMPLIGTLFKCLHTIGWTITVMLVLHWLNFLFMCQKNLQKNNYLDQTNVHVQGYERGEWSSVSYHWNLSGQSHESLGSFVVYFIYKGSCPLTQSSDSICLFNGHWKYNFIQIYNLFKFKYTRILVSTDSMVCLLAILGDYKRFLKSDQWI